MAVADSVSLRVSPAVSPTGTARSVRSGFTLIELLVTMAIFILVLAALGGLLVSSTRTYQVTAQRSEALQDAEAALQLLRHELGLAGYRGLEAATFNRPFTIDGQDTIAVRRTGAGDEVTVRYFEDRFVVGDSGERSVTFRVNGGTQTLERIERRPSGASTNELLVGNVRSMEVLELVGPNRIGVPLATVIADESAGPQSLAGLLFLIEFDDGRDWQFLIGLPNPQNYAVSSGG